MSEFQLTGQSITNGPPLWILDNLLSKEECMGRIARANAMNDDNKGNRAWHAPGTGGKYSRVIMIDRSLADDLWNRVRKFLPEVIEGYKLVYLNDHFRFSRYRKGGVFHVHCDGKNYDNSRPDLIGEWSSESLLTLNIFLNTEGDTDYELVGGGTSFFNQDENFNLNLRTTVKAKAGRAVLFWAKQYHRGDVVDSGFKYLLRTDVMGIRS